MNRKGSDPLSIFFTHPLPYFVKCACLFPASISQGEFHPKALTEPCLNVSAYTALTVQPFPVIIKDEQIANEQIDPVAS